MFTDILYYPSSPSILLLDRRFVNYSVLAQTVLRINLIKYLIQIIPVFDLSICEA